MWKTLDRSPTLTGAVEIAAYAGIAAKCNELRCEIIALGGVEDHVHLVPRPHTTVSCARLAGEVKGVSSRLVTHTLGEEGRHFRCQHRYGTSSVSESELPALIRYVARQREHHGNTTREGWELSDTEEQDEPE